MAVNIEYHVWTGPIDEQGSGKFSLEFPPIIGENGEPRVLIEPSQGPVQVLGSDWELVNSDTISCNLEGSSIREIRRKFIEDLGVDSQGPQIRVIYEY